MKRYYSFMKTTALAAIFFMSSQCMLYAQQNSDQSVVIGGSGSKQPDAEVYTDSKDIPNPATHRKPGPEYLGPYGNAKNFQFNPGDFHGKSTTVYERELARWKDPLTPPHSRMECVKWASGSWPWGGGWKTCIGHAYQWQWMYVTAHLTITTGTPSDMGAIVDECFRDGAVAGAAAAIITGGSAGLETFGAVMKGCVVAKVGANLLSFNVYTSSQWGDWE